MQVVSRERAIPDLGSPRVRDRDNLRRRCSVALVLAVSLIGGSRSSRAQSIARITERFYTELERLQTAEGFPGATGAFALADGRVVGVAVGFADRERSVPMHPDSRMLAASIGKTFVAATAVALAHEGKVDLDDPISKFLGDEPWLDRLPWARAVTMRMLLSHSSGIANNWSDSIFAREWVVGVKSNPDYAPAPRDLIRYVEDRPPLFPPGRSFAYTDTGYLIAGLVIEKVSRSTLYQEVQRRFLDPLALTLTSPSNRRFLPGLAAGYSAHANRFNMPDKTSLDAVMVYNPAIEWAGGGFISNSKDLVRWAKALYEERAMPAPYLEEMMAGVSGNPVREPSGNRYGLSIRIAETPLGITYGHGGAIPGYRSQIAYFPKQRVAIAIQVNTDVPPIYERIPSYVQALAKVVLDEVPQ